MRLYKPRLHFSPAAPYSAQVTRAMHFASPGPHEMMGCWGEKMICTPPSCRCIPFLFILFISWPPLFHKVDVLRGGTGSADASLSKVLLGRRESDCALSSCLILPDSFGSIHRGETFCA
jgi:hypothetical protein